MFFPLPRPLREHAGGGVTLSWPSIPTSRRRISTDFLAGYDIGELLSYKGIAEGVENSNFLLHTERRQFHPHAVREAGRGGRSAVLPRR